MNWQSIMASLELTPSWPLHPPKTLLTLNDLSVTLYRYPISYGSTSYTSRLVTIITISPNYDFRVLINFSEVVFASFWQTILELTKTCNCAIYLMSYFCLHLSVRSASNTLYSVCSSFPYFWWTRIIIIAFLVFSISCKSQKSHNSFCWVWELNCWHLR